MKPKIWFLSVLVVASLAALPLCAQNFPGKGDDSAQSFGKFWILIDPPYQAMFAGCPAYNATTHVLESPTLYENGTIIGRSAPIKEGSPGDSGGVPVGTANTMVRDGGMVVPPGFAPIAPNSNEVHTEIRHLNMETYPPVPPANRARVRAGVCYGSTTCSPPSPPPANRISRGEVVSNHAPAGAPPDFPARSYFNVFAQIDIPACGSFPGATVYNKAPLLVHTPSISGFPPSGAVYIHDSSSAVGVFLGHGGPKWEKGKRRLGCVILAGHGVIPTFHRAALDEAPSLMPVSLQKGQAAPQREVEAQKVRPPDKQEVEKEAENFNEHMKREHGQQGGRHKDCGPPGKDDDKDD